MFLNGCGVVVASRTTSGPKNTKTRMNNHVHPPPPRPVSLETVLFQEKLAQHMEETKPDPLMRKQLEGWRLEWQDEEDDNGKIQDSSSSSWHKQHRIHGTLRIEGEYVAVLIKATCEWTWNVKEEGAEEEGGGGGCLFFQLQTRAELLLNKSSSGNNIRSRMITRLRQDDYIQKILDDKQWFSVCETSVKLFHNQQQDQQDNNNNNNNNNGLEERVWVDNENGMEAIRRCVYSQAESPLSIIEILVCFPYLDTTTSGCCPLGNRAKLRILEDAMLEECEREGEGDLLQDLQVSSSLLLLSPKDNNNNNNNNQQDEKGGRKKHKKGAAL